MAIAIRFIPFAMSWVSVLLLVNYFGQRIINEKEKLFYTAYYRTKWYLMPVKFRRMVLMISINSSNLAGLSAGKMGDVSLEAAGIVSFN